MVFESKTKQILMIQKPKGVCLAWNYRNEKEKLTTNVFFLCYLAYYYLNLKII